MRTIIVSNRLPFTAVNATGQWTFESSIGGLATGLSAYLNGTKSSAVKYLWVGWPGIFARGKDAEDLRSLCLAKFNALPVMIPDDTMDGFYRGFCNSTIWPLFHNFPSYTKYIDDHWVEYEAVNRRFLESIHEILLPEDTIWIHDYHLMLLPRLLREKRIGASIGFFLHIPFPPLEIFQLLPRRWGRAILEGLLGSDLIGFHTYDYTEAFLRSVLRILNHEHNLGVISLDDRTVKADTFPMGVDFEAISHLANSSRVIEERDRFRAHLRQRKIILSIDRLDYTKGLVSRLKAYELFLQRNPDWSQRVSLVLAISPSRSRVEDYQTLKGQIDEHVGRINGTFGSVDWTPILYQYRQVPKEDMIGMYAASDVALVTPLRDGMNLVAKEFLTSKTDDTGVLVLSAMAGAAMELGEAVIVNPNDAIEVVDALKTALEMPREEQIRRNRIMKKRLERYDVTKWGDDFLTRLKEVKEEQRAMSARILPIRIRERMVREFRSASRRILFLDYDGTLVDFSPDPYNVRPSKELLELLRNLDEQPATKIVIASGRDRKTLRDWFGQLHLSLVAEHGAWVMENGRWSLTRPLPNDWKRRLMPLLNDYTDRLPGSLVEEKEYSITWHYRHADPELAAVRVGELRDALIGLTSNMNVQVYPGHKIIELRNGEVSKATAATHFLSENQYDFILAIGDDSTDEELFKVLPGNAYSLRVGMDQSYSKYNVHRYKDVLELLHEFSQTGSNGKLNLLRQVRSSMIFDPGRQGTSKQAADNRTQVRISNLAQALWKDRSKMKPRSR